MLLFLFLLLLLEVYGWDEVLGVRVRFRGWSTVFFWVGKRAGKVRDLGIQIFLKWRNPKEQ